jgi:hypothetical protein
LRASPAMNPGERYLALALRIGRLAPGLVDSYTGPPEIAAAVEAEAARPADELAAEARDLRADAEQEDDPARRRWLGAQLAALETVCATLGGERISYRALVERCYGVPARIESEDAFAAAHDALDDALPGPGTVAQRYQAWLTSQTVPVALLPAAIEVLAGDLRARTRAAFEPPDGERVDFELVSDRPWAVRRRRRSSRRAWR